jgi:hypothetical protein
VRLKSTVEASPSPERVPLLGLPPQALNAAPQSELTPKVALVPLQFAMVMSTSAVEKVPIDTDAVHGSNDQLDELQLRSMWPFALATAGVRAVIDESTSRAARTRPMN